MPTWLMSPGPVLLRRFVRTKGEPLRDEVELLDANPTYAHVRYPKEMKVLFPLPISRLHNQSKVLTQTSTHVVPASDVALLPTAPPNVNVDERAVQSKDQTEDVTTAPDENARELKRLDYDVLARERRSPERFGEWTI